MENYNYTIVNGKKVPLKYSVPSSILHRFTGEFLDIFNTELHHSVFGEFKQMDLNKHNVLPWLIETVGWHESFSKACEKLGMADVLEYYKGLERYDSIIFNKELCRLLRRWEKRRAGSR